MAIYTAFRLRFKSPLHLGSVRADYDTSETIQHSDTLYAAIVQAWCALGLENKLQLLIKDTGEPRGFTLSSLFPFYAHNNDYTYFFPIPMGTVESAENEIKLRKKIKKAEFVDSHFFRKIQEKGKTKVIQKDIFQKFITKEKDFDKDFIDKQVFPRARVPRSGITNETEIYYIERIFFKENSGLFCLAYFEDEAQKENILAMLKYLGDEGIGTDRYVGHGLFDVEEVEDMSWAPDLNLKTAYRTNVSLFLPEDKNQLSQFIDEHARYKMVKRGGWITSPSYLTYRKQSVHMFLEGSIFRFDDHIAGKTVDLKPRNLPPGKDVPIPIYRSGKSFFLPINLDNN